VEPTSLRFARLARTLGDAARAQGLTVPSFRSPPRLPGHSRTIHRRGPGDTTVGVVLRDRPWAAVAADRVEGVIVANRLTGARAERARSALWSAVGDVTEKAA
jgi:hypothetical protein